MARIIIGVAIVAVGLFVPWASPMVGAMHMGMIMTGASMVIGGIAQKLMGKHSADGLGNAHGGGPRIRAGERGVCPQSAL